MPMNPRGSTEAAEGLNPRSTIRPKNAPAIPIQCQRFDFELKNIIPITKEKMGVVEFNTAAILLVNCISLKPMIAQGIDVLIVAATAIDIQEIFFI